MDPFISAQQKIPRGARDGSPSLAASPDQVCGRFCARDIRASLDVKKKPFRVGEGSGVRESLLDVRSNGKAEAQALKPIQRPTFACRAS
jgi:hypothetical protein